MKFVRSKSGDTVPRPAKAPKAPKPSKTKGAAKRGKAGEGRKLSGRKQFVLMIGDEGAILVFMQGATVVRRLFAASPQMDHTSAILELMNANPKVPLSILADVIDQQYVRHTFPPVSALSLNNLVKRRIARDFQPEDIIGSVKLGRDKTGRKEWQYLLIALAYTPLLQQWLDLIVEQPNELKGIHLVPVECQNYIQQLHRLHAQPKEKPLPWQLLVSHHKVSGFRQAVLKNGKLVFTRVTQAIDDAVPAVIAGNIEQEIMNTLEYLRRLGFTENNSMHMMVIAAAEVQETLDINRFKAGQAHVMTPLEVAEGLGLEQAAMSADRFGDVVMAAAFARSRKRVMKLMTAYGAKLSKLYAARKGIKILGSLIVVGLIGMSLMNIYKTTTNRSAAADTEQQRQPIQNQLATVKQAINGLNKDVAFKAAVMLTYDAYLKDVHLPQEFVDQLAPFLSENDRAINYSWGPPAAPGGEVPPPSDNSTNGPLQMTVQFEFTAPFADTTSLAKHATDFIATLKTAMPQYDIAAYKFPWEGEQPTATQLTFDKNEQAQSQIKEGSNRIRLVFRGPKPGTNPSGAAPAAPPVPPGGMVP